MRVADMHRRYRIRLDYTEAPIEVPLTYYVRLESARQQLEAAVVARPTLIGVLEGSPASGHYLAGEWEVVYQTRELRKLLASWRYWPYKLVRVARWLVGRRNSFVVTASATDDAAT